MKNNNQHKAVITAVIVGVIALSVYTATILLNG